VTTHGFQEGYFFSCNAGYFLYPLGMFTIFDKLGGETEALALLKDGAIREGWPSADTIKLWRKKRELPGPVIRRLMRLCDERGVTYSSSDFEAAISAPSSAPMQHNQETAAC
jgi:hypothetical protein